MTGLVMAVPRKYETYALENIQKLIADYNWDLPIEIWEVGSEISEEIREALSEIPLVQFRNVQELTDTPNHWRGFQVKAFAAYHTHFDQFILTDADITFFQDPRVIFDDPGYQSTGTYFFRDLTRWKFYRMQPDHQEKFHSLRYFNNRKHWIRQIMPKKSPYFPKEWAFIYSPFRPIRGVLESYMEAGVMYFHGQKVCLPLQTAFELNNDHQTIYQYVHGDKETWWLACCIHNQPFTMNPQVPEMVGEQLTHTYQGRKFFTQK